MRESGEPMEFGIFDFYKVFSRAFGEEGNGASGDLEWKLGDVALSVSPPMNCGTSIQVVRLLSEEIQLR